MVRQEWKDKLDKKDIGEIMKDYNPIFVVTDNSMTEERKEEMHKA